MRTVSAGVPPQTSHTMMTASATLHSYSVEGVRTIYRFPENCFVGCGDRRWLRYATPSTTMSDRIDSADASRRKPRPTATRADAGADAPGPAGEAGRQRQQTKGGEAGRGTGRDTR